MNPHPPHNHHTASMMERALELAAQARLLAPPNPAVGCVLVSAGGQIIGEATPRPPARPMPR